MRWVSSQTSNQNSNFISFLSADSTTYSINQSKGFQPRRLGKDHEPADVMYGSANQSA